MNGNDLANPVKHSHGEEFFTAGGFTKRELIAAMAMQGLLGNASVVGYKANYAELFETLSEMSVKQADALIERLSADPVAEGVNLLPMYSRELDEGLDNDQDRGASR
jgi:hypothetical protein